MPDKLITEMSAEEFDAVIEAYIERETQDLGAIPAPVFFEALHDIFRVEPMEETIELHGQVVGSQL